MLNLLLNFVVALAAQVCPVGTDPGAVVCLPWGPGGVAPSIQMASLQSPPSDCPEPRQVLQHCTGNGRCDCALRDSSPDAVPPLPQPRHGLDRTALVVEPDSGFIVAQPLWESGSLRGPPAPAVEER
jgi:hypothetical protein